MRRDRRIERAIERRMVTHIDDLAANRIAERPQAPAFLVMRPASTSSIVTRAPFSASASA